MPFLGREEENLPTEGNLFLWVKKTEEEWRAFWRGPFLNPILHVSQITTNFTVKFVCVITSFLQITILE